jgi:predicted GTPase
MNRLVQWLACRRLTPAAAQIEFLSRRVNALEAMLRQQHGLVESQQQALKTLRAALIKAQFDAEGWRQVAHEQARQMQFTPSAAKEAP